jgi:branched-chain amino acid transport system substrate-binding protein
VSAGAKAYFDDVNAAGGINGRKLQLDVVDDKGDPQAAAQAARTLIDDDVVANVGSGSALECSVNGPAYVKAGLVSIQGLAADYGCFHNANIAPVNAGPFVASALELYYASEVLKKERVCFAAPKLPGYAPGYEEAISQWQQVTGKKLVVDERSYDIAGDPTPYILRMKKAGCEAVAMIGSEPNGVPWFKAVQAQNAEDITWVWPTSVYSDTFLEAGGSTLDGLYIFSEFQPFSEADDPALEDWRKSMKAHGVAETSNALGGYLSAKIFVDTLKGIDGPLTRESITDAFKTMKPYDTDLLGAPWEFGPGDAHAPSTSGKFLQVEDGAFVLRTPDWVQMPEDGSGA